MNGLWVIEQGGHSDYGVLGVYSTKEGAERVAALVNASGPCELATVAEWPLDPGIAQLDAGMSQWVVRMLRDGSVERVSESSITPVVWRDANHLVINWVNGREVPGKVLYCYLWATDAVHAVRIVNERRIQMIAEGKWPAPMGT